MYVRIYFSHYDEIMKSLFLFLQKERERKKKYLNKFFCLCCCRLLKTHDLLLLYGQEER